MPGTKIYWHQNVIKHATFKIKIASLAHYMVFLKMHNVFKLRFVTIINTNTHTIKHFRRITSFRGIDYIKQI